MEFIRVLFEIMVGVEPRGGSGRVTQVAHRQTELGVDVRDTMGGRDHRTEAGRIDMGIPNMVTQQSPRLCRLASKHMLATAARWVVAADLEPIFL